MQGMSAPFGISHRGPCNARPYTHGNGVVTVPLSLEEERLWRRERLYTLE